MRVTSHHRLWYGLSQIKWFRQVDDFTEIILIWTKPRLTHRTGADQVRDGNGIDHDGRDFLVGPYLVSEQLSNLLCACSVDGGTLFSKCNTGNPRRGAKYFLEYFAICKSRQAGAETSLNWLPYSVHTSLPIKVGIFSEYFRAEKNCWIGTIKTKGSVRTCFLPSQSQYSLLHWLWNYNNLLQANQ